MTVREEIEAAHAKLSPIFEELAGESDRAAAITACSYLEPRVDRALRSRLVPLTKKLDQTLFAGYGPLSTLSARIDVGYALGLYGKMTRADLHRIRSIRNSFAHDVDIRSFSHDKIAKACTDLEILRAAGHADTMESDFKGLYMLTLMVIGQALGEFTGTREGTKSRLP